MTQDEIDKAILDFVEKISVLEPASMCATAATVGRCVAQKVRMDPYDFFECAIQALDAFAGDEIPDKSKLN